MTTALSLLPLGLAIAAAGAALARCGQPACHWSSLGAMALKTRLAMLRRLAPSRRRARVCVLGLAGLICAAGLAAYAAEPSAPEQLTAQAAGVVGSGNQLGLRLVEAGQERTLRPGDLYADGWKLDALTATSATLVKDGERREVGLNPTGALAATTAAPPSQVRVALSDADLLDRVIRSGLWDGKTPRPGLTLPETQRYYVLQRRAMDIATAYSADINARSRAAGLGGVNVLISNERIFAPALGPADGTEFIALMKGQHANRADLASALYDHYGPVEVTMSTTFDHDAYAKREADYPGTAWSVRPGAEPNTQIFVLSPPDPRARTMIPDTVPTMDEAALVSAGGPPYSGKAYMPASKWLAQTPSEASKP